MTDGYIALNDLLPKLDALDGKSRVTVHINSVGGDLLSGIAIYNRLKSLSGQIITVCDSLAASAGSIIFQAGDVRQVYASSTVMVHHALTIMWGMYNAADLRKSAEDLDGFDRQLVNAYVERTGLDEAAVLAHMDAESWMVGQEAVDAGFADQVIAGEAQTISDSDTPGVLNVGRLRVAAHFIPARSETCGPVPKARDEPAAHPEAAKNINQKGKEPMNKKLFARNEAPEEEKRTEAEETEEQRPENEGEEQTEQEPAAEITTVEELREAYPYLVEQITDQDGNVVSKHDATPIRQVISEETSALVREIMEREVTDGTGKNGQVAGYRIGGKTGTADKVGGNVIVSFACFAPADDPQVMMLLTLDEPNKWTGTYVSGGNMVAPVASSVMSEILPYLGIEPNYTAEELVGADMTVPNVVGLAKDAAIQKLAASGFGCRSVGSGDTVTDQTPAGGAIVPNSAEIILYLGAEKSTDKCIVPNVVGDSAATANQKIVNAGLIMGVSGATNASSSSVRAISQSVDPGTEVAAGTVVRVQFSDSSVRD